MKFFCAIVLLSIAAASAVKDDDMWNFYKAHYGKKHHSSVEAKRKAHFLATHKKIEKHNSENKSWHMGHNKFSDMSESERKAMLGAKPTISHEMSTMNVDVAPVEERALPASYDLRSDPCMQPVKDQGQCGSCYTFATINPLEFNQCKKTNTSVALSEQMLVDCDTNDYGCDGGMYTNAWAFLKTKGGAMKSSAYSYVSGTTQVAGTTCKYDSTQVGAKVSSYTWTGQPGVKATSTTIMTKLSTPGTGPMPSAIKIVDSFFSYAGGVYSDPTCIVTDTTDVNHAIVIVGYGTTTATSTTPATDYWIVRNSWSTGWGQGGYFYIQRGNNMCNIEAWTASVQVV